MNHKEIEYLRHLSRKLIRELGMLELPNATPEYWHALIEIDREDGITISKLGNLLLMSISKISRIVKSLIKDELIKLEAGIDKREKYLYITIVGKESIKHIDNFSTKKIKGALDFLNDQEIMQITDSIDKYSSALEKSRLEKEAVKIVTISTSRTVRKQIIEMIENIQKNEFSIPISDDVNLCILKAEQNFYYNNSYNFWYATDNEGKIIGSIGLKKINQNEGEIKKFFVVKKYRGKGIAQRLMNIAINAAKKHKFEKLFLGTVDKLEAAHRFYEKYDFKYITENELPKNFEKCLVDTVFFQTTI